MSGIKCPLTLSVSKGVSGWARVAACTAHMVRQAHHERAWGVSRPNLVRSYGSTGLTMSGFGACAGINCPLTWFDRLTMSGRESPAFPP